MRRYKAIWRKDDGAANAKKKWVRAKRAQHDVRSAKGEVRNVMREVRSAKGEVRNGSRD